MSPLLQLYDSGVVLPRAIEQILFDAGGRATEVGVRLVQAALSMKDYSARQVQTPVGDTDRTDVLKVGDTLIAIGTYARRACMQTPQPQILLSLPDENEPAMPLHGSGTSARLSDFVATTVVLRAAGSSSLIRHWITTLLPRS